MQTAEILMNGFVIAATLAIFAAIGRQMRPPPKRSHNGEALVCISRGKVFSSEWLYFNSRGVFVYRRGVLQAAYGFEDMVSLHKNGVTINHVRVWELLLKGERGMAGYTFRPSLRGFGRFYRHVCTIRPEVVKSRWYGCFPGI